MRIIYNLCPVLLAFILEVVLKYYVSINLESLMPIFLICSYRKNIYSCISVFIQINSINKILVYVMEKSIELISLIKRC